MPVAGVAIVPLGTETPSISSFVAGCVKVLETYPDVRYQLTPMATVLEGDLVRVLEAVKEMHEVPFESGAMRVVTTLTIDDRRDKDLTMEGKADSVRAKL